MLYRTEAIVLNYIKYSETSIIVHVYTLDHGYQSLMVSGVRNKKARLGIGLFQSFNWLEVIYYYNPNRDLHRLKDAKILHPQPELVENLSKRSMVLFICEILNKVLHGDHSENKALFSFLSQSSTALNDQKESYESFHLFFLVHLSRYLGFGLSDEADLITPEMDNTIQHILSELIRADHYGILDTTGDIRYTCLERILRYYAFHLENLGEIKSLKVLREIFH